MASTAEAGLSAGSNLVSGAGSNRVTFTLPASPLYIVQSVVATVDNTAGGDTTATLTYADTAGEVIATQNQDDVIPAGGTGTASFALRSGASGGGIRFRKLNTGTWLSVTTTGSGPSGYSQRYVAGNGGFEWVTPAAGTFDFSGGGSASVNWNVGAVTFNTNGGQFQVNTANGGAQFVNGAFTVNAAGQGIILDPQVGLLQLGVQVTDQVGFFGAAPVVQQATPVTLGDVIALLQSYGLSA